MANALSSLRVESVREVLSAISPLISWKTLALLLAIVNLKNMPLIWHVSTPDYSWPRRRAGLIQVAPCSISLLGKHPMACPGPIFSQGNSPSHSQREADASSIRFVRHLIPSSTLGDGLQPAQVQQHVLLRPGRGPHGPGHPSIQPRSFNREQGTRHGAPGSQSSGRHEATQAQGHLCSPGLGLLQLQA